MGRGGMTSCLIFMMNHLGLCEQEGQTLSPPDLPLLNCVIAPGAGTGQGGVSTEGKTRGESWEQKAKAGRICPGFASCETDNGDPHRFKSSEIVCKV